MSPKRPLMEKETTFSVTFDGDPLEEGAMEVQYLAPALLGLGDAIDEINNLVTSGETRVTLRVRAGFRRGSFHVDLDLAQAIYQKFVDLFNSPQATAWTTFFSLLGLSGIGVIPLIKRSKGKKPKTILEIEETSRVRVTFEGDEPVEVDNKVWKLFNNSRARMGIGRFVRPLRHEGMKKIILARENELPVEIARDEAEYLGPLTEHDNELVTESERVLRIVGMSFKEGNKWRVAEGSNGFYATIADEGFAHRVQGGIEKFSANDFLRVILRTRQWYEGSEIKASYEIIKILEHIEGEPGQGSFKFERPDKNKGKII